jgi:PAS domain S-box-containing protein
LLILVVLVFPILTSLCLAAAEPEPRAKNVLVLFSGHGEHDPEFLNLLESTVRARVSVRVNFFVSSLAYPISEERSHWGTLAETFRGQYSGVKPDLVIASSLPALQFVAEYRDKLFPGVPIVFIAITDRELREQSKWPDVTGVTVPVGLRETIDLALHLHPDTQTLAIVTGPSFSSNYWLAVAHAELLRYHDRVKEIDILGPANHEMVDRIAAFPPHTVALFSLSPDTVNQPAFGGWDVLSALARRVPTYSAWSALCHYGCIGGAYEDARKEGLATAEIAARILSGERAENIPILHATDLQVRVDAQALQRWHIPESALPPGSVIINREPGFRERDRKYIVTAAVVIVAQFVWITALLWQRARKRKAEAVMRESEKRFRVMADTTPSLIWMADQSGKITYLNSKSVEFTGDPRAGFGDSWSEYVHPDDLDSVLSANAGALAKRVSFSKEYRLRRYDGVYRWMFDVASPRVNGDGSFAGFIGSAIDITDQKAAQDALEKVSGRLIEAQEKERSRIARDLHDDICQRLALLSMELEQANRTLNEAPAITNRRLEEIQRHCSEITGDVQALSHQLHSSKLDYLEITAAIRSFCKEFARQHGASVEFAEEGLPTHLPKDVSLCLFRVTQEALHNAVKYSGTNQYTVDLKSDSDKVKLGVSDTGVGFDVEAARRNGGLGLLSMQERVNLVHGEFFIESSPSKGTRIVAKVPVTVKADAEAGGGNQDARIAGAA